MDWDRIQQKLHILSDAAKYDVSCSCLSPLLALSSRMITLTPP